MHMMWYNVVNVIGVYQRQSYNRQKLLGSDDSLAPTALEFDHFK